MTLYLSEIVTTVDPADDQVGLLDVLAAAVAGASARPVEFLVSRAGRRVFVVAETEAPVGLAAALRSAVGTAGRLDVGPVAVRLVGAEAEAAAGPAPAGYLVEWDLPADLTMDRYLDRKKANSVRYADVPQTTFLRTYVREDLVKCLCLYDAPSESDVRAARAAVDAPVDRLTTLDQARQPQ